MHPDRRRHTFEANGRFAVCGRDGKPAMIRKIAAKQKGKKITGEPQMSAEKAEKPRMSDAAVQSKTGKTWGEWFALLDRAGAMKMTHKEIVGYLSAHHSLGPWWRQMVAVTYEHVRGLREKHEKPGGYEISRSKTIAASAEQLYAAVYDDNRRANWLPGHQLAIRTAKPGKSIRMTWSDGLSIVVVNFYPKGEGKTQVVVQHDKLKDASQGEKMKQFWADKLQGLQASLAG